MKANRTSRFWIALLAIACGLQVFFCISYLLRHNYNWACDFIYRYNEINCMHDRIDPFDIFERKITSEHFRGHDRPDKPDEPEDSRRIVHAYPAWHTPIFWWYGYTPKWFCLAFLTILYVYSLSLACRWTSQKLAESQTKDLAINLLFIVTMTLYSFIGICHSMNYGLLLLGCTLLLCSALDSNHDILAGIIYSFIMIKPQIGVLLFFPLFFSRKYKTIAVSITICLIETCFTACMLRKSPIELILQIPQIGAPFEKGYLVESTMKIIGPIGQYIVMGIFICLAAGGSYLIRNAKEAWIRFLPAIAFIPFWTYSQPHDWLVILPCYVFILNSKCKHQRIVELCFAAEFLRNLLLYAHSQKWYAIGKEGIITILFLAIVFSCYLIVIMDYDENMRIHNLFSKLSNFGKIKCSPKT